MTCVQTIKCERSLKINKKIYKNWKKVQKLAKTLNWKISNSKKKRTKNSEKY